MTLDDREDYRENKLRRPRTTDDPGRLWIVSDGTEKTVWKLSQTTQKDPIRPKSSLNPNRPGLFLGGAESVRGLQV